MIRLALALAFLATTSSAAEATDWKEEANKNGLLIQSRSREGSALKEFRGTGVIDASPATVFAVLDDLDAYPAFMPYTAECRVLKRGQDYVISYQRLALPLLNDRDYTVRSEHSKTSGAEGASYRTRWSPVNDLGPAAKPGVVRVNLCEGGWLLEPSGPNQTRATYQIYTDSGGVIPPFIANNGSRVAIRKLFEAIRQRVRDPKYAAAGRDTR